MRMKRLRIDDGETPGSYYHLYNRAVGSKKSRLFDRVAKEHLAKLVIELGGVYAVDVLGFVIMSNHYHIVVFAPHELPSQEVAAARWQTMYPEQPPPATPEDWLVWRNRLRNISDFIKILQQKFTCWHNRYSATKPDGLRRGALWAGCYKSTLLDGSHGQSAVWTCRKYIELNPVRAGMISTSAAYRWEGVRPFLAGLFWRKARPPDGTPTEGGLTRRREGNPKNPAPDGPL